MNISKMAVKWPIQKENFILLIQHLLQKNTECSQIFERKSFDKGINILARFLNVEECKGLRCDARRCLTSLPGFV